VQGQQLNYHLDLELLQIDAKVFFSFDRWEYG
jgi:hypothetical protein